jgi:hypothetical protein
VRSILRSFRIAALVASVAAGLAAPASAADDPTLSEIVNILHEKGLITDEEHEALAAKATKEQAKHAWTDRISLFGDLRGRMEAFEYEQDTATEATGGELQDRARARYRARLGVSAKVVSRASATIALNTNGADPRSGNQTLGSGNDFDKDEFRVDLAYATLSPFADGVLPGVQNGYLAFDVGKVKNPFVWKALGVDNLLFDNDINPEGANLRITGGAGPLTLFANGGVYVIDENSAHSDPKMLGGQLGGALKVADHVSLGARGSLYHFFALDDAFFLRAACDNNSRAGCANDPGGTGGNIVDGLSRRNGSIQVGETAAFLDVGVIEWLPMVIYGSYVHNFSARSSLVSDAGREDDAWTAGIFLGDKVTLVRVGVAYYYLEANAFPSMFVESDVLDGTPNRRGFLISLERQLFENVDLALRGFSSDNIESGAAFADSVKASDRLRGQADITLRF